MSKEQVDRETAAAARKAANTYRYLAEGYRAAGMVHEEDRLLSQAKAHDELAARLESKYDDEE